jgi:hypothetical protein
MTRVSRKVKVPVNGHSRKFDQRHENDLMQRDEAKRCFFSNDVRCLANVMVQLV